MCLFVGFFDTRKGKKKRKGFISMDGAEVYIISWIHNHIISLNDVAAVVIVDLLDRVSCVTAETYTFV